MFDRQVLVDNVYGSIVSRRRMSQWEGVSEADRLAVWTVGEGWCPVTAAVNLLGHKWHPVIIHKLLNHDSLRFNELQTEVGGVTSKVLSESLDDLGKKGLLIESSLLRNRCASNT